jgi:hypothetical protein
VSTDKNTAMPTQYRLMTEVWVGGELRSFSHTVTREFLEDAHAAVPFLLEGLDDMVTTAREKASSDG